jgi:hypothetical protein
VPNPDELREPPLELLTDPTEGEHTGPQDLYDGLDIILIYVRGADPDQVSPPSYMAGWGFKLK